LDCPFERFIIHVHLVFMLYFPNLEENKVHENIHKDGKYILFKLRIFLLGLNFFYFFLDIIRNSIRILENNDEIIFLGSYEKTALHFHSTFNSDFDWL